jgi:chromosome partitioning protein
MAQIIGMMNQKGGSGKSTTVEHVSITMASTGKRVLIVDTDPQQTSYKFFLRNHDAFPAGYNGVIDVVKADKESFLSILGQYKKNYDYVFVDTAPALGQSMGQIIQACDLVIVCVQPTFKDVEATEGIVNSIKANQANIKKLKAVFCITRRPPRKNISATLAKLKEYDLPIMATQIRDYVCYDHADNFGVGMIHLDTKNAENATSDIHEFTTELTSILGQ